MEGKERYASPETKPEWIWDEKGKEEEKGRREREEKAGRGNKRQVAKKTAGDSYGASGGQHAKRAGWRGWGFF